MNRKFAAAVLCGIAAFCGTAQEFKTDFAPDSNVPEMTLNRRAKMEDGVLKIGNWGEGAFSLQVKNPLQISFRARCVKRHPGKQPSAWIVSLEGAGKESGMFRFRQDGCLESYFYKNGQRKGGLIKKIAIPEDGAWFHVCIAIRGDMLSVKLNGAELGSAKHPGFLSLQKVSFTAYNVEWEIDDLSVAPVSAETERTREKKG